MASINQVKRVVRIGMKSGVSVWIWGPHGQGKSDLVKQVAQEEGMECIDIRAALTEAGDWMGLPYVTRNDKGQEIMKFAPSPFLPIDPNSRGILFLDELNRARPDVLNCVFQLALDKKIGSHYTLPKGWYVVVAANPDDSDYQVTATDPALIGRFCHVHLTPTVAEWIDYAKKYTVRDDVRQFITDNEKLLGTAKETTKLEHVKANPRSWALFARMISAMEELELMQECLTEVGNGLVGSTCTIEYANWLKTKFKRIDAQKILLTYEDVRKDVLNMVKTGRLDALKDAIDSLLDVGTPENPGKFNYKVVMADQKQLKNMSQFFIDIAADVAFTGLNKIVSTFPAEFTKALMAADGKKELYKKITSLAEK